MIYYQHLLPYTFIIFKLKFIEFIYKRFSKYETTKQTEYKKEL